MTLLVALCSFIAGFFCTWMVLRYAASLRLVASVNDRSSHVRPTPTGGGIGFVIPSMLAGVWFASAIGLPAILICFLGMLIACVGLLDDLFELRATLRLAVQLAALALLVWLVPVRFAENTGPALEMVLVLGLVIAGIWWINLFNFMDGIDGLAGTQAILILSLIAIILFTSSTAVADHPGFLLIVAVTFSTAGFLVLNWPPGKIFMGDVGSTYLAFMILGLAFLTSSFGWIELPVWVILCAVMTCDATVTLANRMLRGEKWLSAHRQHAYQQLSRRFGHHRPVTLLYSAATALWLFPLALFAHFFGSLIWLWLALAYLPLIALALLLGAGRPDNA